MQLEIRRLTPEDRDRIRRAIFADMEERGDLCCTRREWIASAFDELREKILRGRQSFDAILSGWIVGPRIRKHNRENQERSAKEAV